MISRRRLSVGYNDFSALTQSYLKYSPGFLHPIKTAEAFEAINWLADLPQRTRPQSRPPVE